VWADLTQAARWKRVVRKGKPARQRATYHRNGGTRKLLGAYDVGADRLWGHVEKRRVTGEVVLKFLKDIRRRYPAETTVYIVMDNLSAHWTQTSGAGR